MRNEGLYETWIPFCLKLLFQSAFTDAEKEVVILRTAWRTGADYEWGHHLRFARKAGLSEEQIEAIATPAPQLRPEQPEHEHLGLLVRATDELLDLHTVSPEVAGELAEAFTEQQRIELPMLVGHYSLLAMLLRSLDIPFDTFAKKKVAS